VNYWQERTQRAQEQLSKKRIAETEKQLTKYYAATMEEVTGQFVAVYNKVMLDAAEGHTPTPADLYKLNSYWQMQGRLQKELHKLGDKQAVWFGRQFVAAWEDVYYNIALPDAGLFSAVDRSTVQQMINQIWCADGQTWSSRIWANTDKLQQALNDGLIECVVTGKSPVALKEKLVEQFNVSWNRADSIVKTEIAHIQTQAAQQRYKDAGLDEVEIWADEDERRCDVCGKLHQKRYPVGAQMPIPAHPRCRCVLLPVIKRSPAKEQ
jgi:SPP1 gp7 family putative phage head morphogenesis protein